MSKPAQRAGRRSPRLRHDLPVVYRSVGGFLSDWATDISQGGIFINSRTPLPVGTMVSVTVQIPGATFPCVLTGRVARVVEWEPGATCDPGMGIEFTDVDRDERDRIEAFVETVRGALDPG
jgi:uncharacterized protein (TIGR02266 family)